MSSIRRCFTRKLQRYLQTRDTEARAKKRFLKNQQLTTLKGLVVQGKARRRRIANLFKEKQHRHAPPQLCNPPRSALNL